MIVISDAHFIEYLTGVSLSNSVKGWEVREFILLLIPNAYLQKINGVIFVHFSNFASNC